VGSELRFFGDHHHVDGRDAIASFADDGDGALDESAALGIFPLRVAGGKQGPDVGGPDRAEKGVGQGVQKSVSVGVAFEPPGVVDPLPSEDENPPLDETVGVEAEADSHGRHQLSPFLR
jgi:hypothetical protein